MIFDERDYQGLTQDEMGRLLGISGRAISAYEAKRIKPSTEVIIKFLKAFDKKVYIKDRFEEVDEFDFVKQN